MPDKLYKIILIFLSLATLLLISPALATVNLSQRLTGRILLQVTNSGAAWYVNPSDNKRYYLGRPTDAFDLMKRLSIGISNKDLEKISIGQIDSSSGAATNIDLTKIDSKFVNANLGKIFLQVEAQGQAWYLNPVDKKRYFLNRPSDAFAIMRRLALGITDENINLISIGYLNVISSPLPVSNTSATSSNPSYDFSDCSLATNSNQVLNAAANAFRKNQTEAAVACFTPGLEKAIEYTMKSLNSESKLTLGNILSSSKLSNSTDSEDIYSNDVYFSLGGYKVNMKFHIKRQANGKWLMINL